jgi:putative ABC transport system permease protein
VIQIEILRMSLRSLRGHPLRTFLTLLGVIIGVTTVVTVVSIISGLNAYISDKVLTLGADAFVVDRFGIITSRSQLIEAFKRRDISYDDMETIRRLCTECVEVGADVAAPRGVTFEDERLADTPVHGSTANANEAQNLEVVEGRFFTDAEVTSSRPVAVIGHDVRSELFGELASLGRIIKIGGFPFKVIGVLEKKGSILGQNQDKVVYVPLTSWQKVFGARRSLSVLVKAGGKERVEAAQEQVRQILRARRHTAYADPDPFSLVTASALDAIWKGISAGAFALMTAISAISLVVGGIVIMNIMLVSVAERTQEIGVRRALGARRSAIQMQFLMEAVLLSAAGGMIGVAIGWGAAQAVQAFSPLPVSVRPSLVAAALAVATLVGVASGLFPSIQASRLQPTDALRSE